MKRQYRVENLSELAKVAKDISDLLASGTVIGLVGDLGSGKTTLVAHILSCLGVDINAVTSPTFNLVSIYDTQRGRVWHFDLYRINDSRELHELAIDEAMQDIVFIEWPQIAQEILPKDTSYITIIRDDAAESNASESNETRLITYETF